MTESPLDSTATASVVCHHHDQLGEGPVWDTRRQVLSWVDIGAGLLHEWQPGSAAERVRSIGGEVSAAVPRAGGGFVVAVGHELSLLSDEGGLEPIAAVEADHSDNRLNDCRCDPSGRLWIGTMSKSRVPGTAGLYRLDPDRELEPVLTGTTLSNGLGWNDSGELMYFIDSTTQRIDVFDFDAAHGTIGGRRPFVEIDPSKGLPDGLCVDREGGVWVALFGGGAVHRYAEDGSLDAVVDLPVSNPTCPIFGGPELETLYVTSARHLLSDRALATQPLAGALFELKPGVRGLPSTPFAG
jgi:sugar lactone lactonase YvrE